MSRKHLSLSNAVAQNDVALVESLLAQASGRQQGLALCKAAEMGAAQVLPVLLGVHHSNVVAESALLKAVEGKHLACVRMLLGHTHSAAHANALTKAAELGDIECVALLRPMCNMESGRWALAKAAAAGHLDCVRTLAADATNEARSFALQHAALRGQEQCVALLISLAVPHEYMNFNWALRMASEHGHAQCVKILLPMSDPKANDSVALRMAVWGNHHQCVDVLYDFSDVDEVLQFFAGATPSELAYCSDAVAQLALRRSAQQQHHALSSTLAHTETRSKKQQKM